MSDPDRLKRLGEYARVTGAGVPAAAAWQQVFGTYDPVPDLRQYAQQPSVRGYRYHFTERIAPVKGDAIRLADAEIEATLGDELLGVGRREDAEARLKKAAAMEPPSSRAKALLGLERVTDRSYDDARALLVEAAGDRDWLTQYYVAAGLANMIQWDSEERVFATAEIVSRAMEAVLAVRPELPHVLALQGLVAMATQKNVDAAALAVRRARTLAPGREDYAFLEASLHLMRRDYGSAREILAPMMSGAYPERVRDRARTLIGQAVAFEQRDRDSGERRTEPAAPADASATRMVRRPIEPGEQRTEGLLERISCLAQGAVLEGRVADGLLKFFVARLDQVDFISYRSTLTGAVRCGIRTPPDHVYVTWREPPAAAADVKGRAVAVEFLPK
jgi:hypothetical protein